MFGFLIYTSGVILLYTPEALKYLIGFSLFSFSIIAFAELYRKKKTPFENIGITLLGIIYLMVPMLLINYTITFDPTTFDIIVFWPVLIIFILAWTSDTFAYLVGRKFGNKKLFERISPKKIVGRLFRWVIFQHSGAVLIAFLTDQSYLEYITYGFVITTLWNNWRSH